MDKLEKSISINGIVVERAEASDLRGGISVYQPVDYRNDEMTLFFVKGENLLFTQRITADYSQGVGYVDSVTFQNSATNPNNDKQP